MYKLIKPCCKGDAFLILLLIPQLLELMFPDKSSIPLKATLRVKHPDTTWVECEHQGAQKG